MKFGRRKGRNGGSGEDERRDDWPVRRKGGREGWKRKKRWGIDEKRRLGIEGRGEGKRTEGRGEE